MSKVLPLEGRSKDDSWWTPLVLLHGAFVPDSVCAVEPMYRLNADGSLDLRGRVEALDWSFPVAQFGPHLSEYFGMEPVYAFDGSKMEVDFEGYIYVTPPGLV